MKLIHKWLTIPLTFDLDLWFEVERHMGASVLKSPVLTKNQIDSFHDNGFLHMENYFSVETVKALRIIADYINKNPSGLHKAGSKGKYCGFAIHAFETVPEWRDIALRLQLPDTIYQLLGSNQLGYIQDIFHHSKAECFPNGSDHQEGIIHSDMNQMALSIERTRNWGDNMAIAWIALDDLDESTVGFEVFPKSHKWIDAYGNFTFENFCEMDNKVKNKAASGGADLRKKNVLMKPGDVLFFQGLTYHRVSKNRKCEIDSCRRITIRYVDADITSWREDLEKYPSWPFISYFTKGGRYSGRSVKDSGIPAPYLLDRREGHATKLGWLKRSGVLVPPARYWFHFLWQILKKGLDSDAFIANCPHISKDPNVLV